MTTLSERIEAAQKGDALAVESVVLEFSPLIESECAKFGILQHPDLSHSDLFQEAILRVWTRIEQFNGCHARDPEIVFQQWIRATTRSVLSNMLRARKVKKRLPINGLQSFDEAAPGGDRNGRHQQTASSIVMFHEDADRLQVAMEECLDSNAREILRLRVLEGLSIREISTRLPLTTEQVRYNYYKSLAILEKRLAQ